MGRALVVIAISSAVAMVAMAAIVWSMLDRREELELGEHIRATEAAEARDYSNLNSSPSHDTGAQLDRIADAGAPLRSPTTVIGIPQWLQANGLSSATSATPLLDESAVTSGIQRILQANGFDRLDDTSQLFDETTGALEIRQFLQESGFGWPIDPSQLLDGSTIAPELQQLLEENGLSWPILSTPTP